jgi:hypothetical protein
LTNQEIREIEERAEKATPGPWKLSRGAQADAYAIEGEAWTIAHVKFVRTETEANAELLAHSRQDIPKLIAALRETQAQRDRSYEVITRLQLELAAMRGSK